MATLFQFSIRSLLVGVTLAALGIAALLNANAWWEAAAWGAVLFLLSCAALLVVYRRDQQRAFWLGFVVFGGSYLLVVLHSFTADWKNDPLTANPLHYNSLATTKLMALTYESAVPDSRREEYIASPAGVESTVTANSNSGTSGIVNFKRQPMKLDLTGDVSSISFSPDGAQLVFAARATMVSNPSYIPPGKFISIGHTLWLLVIAAVGGKVCQIIYRTRPKETAT